MVPQDVTLIAGSKGRSLLMAGDDDEMFMTRSLNVTLRTAINKNLAIANRSRVSCAHNTLRASIGINVTS